MVKAIINASGPPGNGMNAESRRATANRPKGPRAIRDSDRRESAVVILVKTVFKV